MDDQGSKNDMDEFDSIKSMKGKFIIIVVVAITGSM